MTRRSHLGVPQRQAAAVKIIYDNVSPVLGRYQPEQVELLASLAEPHLELNCCATMVRFLEILGRGMIGWAMGLASDVLVG